MKKATRQFLWASLLMLFGCGWAYGQFSSAIEGSTTDATGAIIPSAKVVLTNTDTGVNQTIESNSAGFYRFSALGPGHYKVEVSAPGFATVTQENIDLTANRVQEVTVQLPVASGEQTVTVTATPSAVETDEAKIQSVTDAEQVAELPIEGRNIYGVANQTPGITGAGLMGQSAANADIFYATTTPAIVANGAPNHSNTYLMDGVSLDDSPSGGDAKLVPNPDSVQEVVVSTSNYSAEFGKAASLVTQITTKSGTNTFHGSGYEQYQSNNLTARNEFQNYKDPINGYITPYHRNEFGGSFGGPIRKDRTFVFGSWDQVISQTTSTGPVTVEDPAFTAWMTANLPNNLSTTLLSKYKPTVASSATSVATVANVEQSQGGAPDAAHNCADTVNNPNGVGPLGMLCSMAMIDTVNGTFISPHNGRQFNVRVDQTFAQSRDRIYGNMYNTHLVGPWDNGVRHSFDINFPQDAWFGAFNYTHVFSPSMLNEMGAGYTRTTVLIPCKYCDLLPTNINGIAGFGDGFSPVGFAQNDFHWRDMVTITRGKHALKTGFEWFHNQDYAPFTIPDNRQQAWGFDNVFDFAADKADNYGTISFDPKTGGTANNNRYFLDSTYGAYVQDDWKIRPDLTLNLGLRWDATSNPSEARGSLSTLTVPAGSDLLTQIEGISVGLNPDPSKRRPFIDHKKTYFAPRFGFAWRPFGARDWSVRGGAGVFFDRGGNTNWSDTETANPPIDANFNASVHTPGSPQPPAFGLCSSAVFPYNCPLPAGLTTTLPPLNARGGFGNFNNIGGPDPHLKMAYMENFFLGVQRGFGANWIAEADLIHSNGIHEYSVTNMNRVDGVNQIVSNGSGGFTETLGPLPNPYFSAINYATNRDGSRYNGFTTYVRRSFNAGCSFQVAFTAQKTIDLMSTVPGQQKGAEYSVVIDAYNVKAQRGLSSQDIAKQVTYNGLWKIPTPGMGNSLLKNVVGGWQLSAMGTLMGGFPATVYSSRPQDDFNLDGFNYDLPDRPTAYKWPLKGLSRSKFLNGTFKTTDFPLPVDSNGVPLGHEGNIGRNTVRGPGFAQTDAALAKDTRLPWFKKESSNLQFRVDMYNAFNRVNLQGWDTNLADGGVDATTGQSFGNFGKATGVAQARTVQLSTKFVF
jgi:outer membrane receptor protein involved in Fe transport